MCCLSARARSFRSTPRSALLRARWTSRRSRRERARSEAGRRPGAERLGERPARGGDHRPPPTAADSQYQQIVALVAEAADLKAPSCGWPMTWCRSPCFAALAGVALAAVGRLGAVRRGARVGAPRAHSLIAAPVAFIGGMSRAARNGVIRQGREAPSSSRARRLLSSTRPATRPDAHRRRRDPSRGTASEQTNCSPSWTAEQHPRNAPAKTSMIEAARNRGIWLTEADRASEQATNGVQASDRGSRYRCRGSSPSSPSMHRMPLAPPSHRVSWPVRRASTAASPARLLASDRVRDNAKATLDSVSASSACARP